MCKKVKGTWTFPSPDYYQTTVIQVLHNFYVIDSFKIEEESPYKPEAFESRLKSNLSHIFAHKELLTITTLQRFLSAQMHTAS